MILLVNRARPSGGPCQPIPGNIVTEAPPNAKIPETLEQEGLDPVASARDNPTYANELNLVWPSSFPG
jgi:hypothetical protein